MDEVNKLFEQKYFLALLFFKLFKLFSYFFFALSYFPTHGELEYLIKKHQLFSKDITDKEVKQIEGYLDRIKKSRIYLNFYDSNSQDVENEILKCSLKCKNFF